MSGFSPFSPPLFDDESADWCDVTQFGDTRSSYLPGVRDLGAKGFAWLEASRAYLNGLIDCDEYERRLDELLERMLGDG